MHTVVTFGLVFVIMLSDVVVARPEPVPMFLVNRAIKAAEFDVKKVGQDATAIPVPGERSADIAPTLESLNENSKTNQDKISHVEKSQIFIRKDRVENVLRTTNLVSSLPVESKLDDPAEFEFSIDRTEADSPIVNRASNAEETNNNEITLPVTDDDKNDDNKEQTASIGKKVAVKKVPAKRKLLNTRKINKVASLNRLRLLDSLIDFLLDSMIPTNDDFRRDPRIYPFDEYSDSAFFPTPYDFNYF